MNKETIRIQTAQEVSKMSFELSKNLFSVLETNLKEISKEKPIDKNMSDYKNKLSLIQNQFELYRAASSFAIGVLEEPKEIK